MRRICSRCKFRQMWAVLFLQGFKVRNEMKLCRVRGGAEPAAVRFQVRWHLFPSRFLSVSTSPARFVIRASSIFFLLPGLFLSVLTGVSGCYWAHPRSPSLQTHSEAFFLRIFVRTFTPDFKTRLENKLNTNFVYINKRNYLQSVFCYSAQLNKILSCFWCVCARAFACVWACVCVWGWLKAIDFLFLNR